MCNDYKDGGSKSVDIVQWQCSWIQKLYNDNFHEWKIIALRYINRYWGKHLRFHCNLNISPNVLYNFPSYCKNMIQYWIKYFSHPPTTLSATASQYLWINSNIKFNKTVVLFKEFSENELNFFTRFFICMENQNQGVTL